MHHAEFDSSPDDSDTSTGPWYEGMKSYHWFVMVVAALGWLFDCLDQQLFVLARPAAMAELLHKQPVDPAWFSKEAALIRQQAPAKFAKETDDLLGHLERQVPTVFDGPEFMKLVSSLPERLPKFESAENFESVKKEVERTSAETAAKIFGDYATSIFLLGWAVGGLFFGVLGDRIGRAKTMLITILLYSAFTGLSALSQGFWDFAAFRFLTGLGVGGEFAVGVALVAEVMPNRARTWCLTLLQMLSAVGNITAAIIGMTFGVLESEGLLTSPWRKMFLIGALPALLALVIRAKLKEPEKWKQAQHSGAAKKQMGSYAELFGHPVWRRNALVGLMLACSGVIGLWAIGFFVPDHTGRVMKPKTQADVFTSLVAAAEKEHNVQRIADLTALQEHMNTKTPVPENLKTLQEEVNKAIKGRSAVLGGMSSLMLQVGAFFGMFGFGYVSQRIGRKPTFALALVAACVSTAAVFWFLKDFSQLLWMVPLMGFCQLSLFAGYAVYFPELFPTHLRSTGTSFCYNVGRVIAAAGPLAKAQLTLFFVQQVGERDSVRYAGVAMCAIFLVGLLALPFAPETKGKPLPE